MKARYAILFCMVVSAAAWADDDCPSGGTKQEGGDGEVYWRSYAASFRKERVCFERTVWNRNPKELLVQWPAADIAEASVKDKLYVSFCCFEEQESASAPLRYGSNLKELSTTICRGHGDEQEYPDLIEVEEAATRRTHIQGTLWAMSRPVRVDVVVTCTASAFAHQYLYQYIIDDASPDPIEIESELLNRMKSRVGKTVEPFGRSDLPARTKKTRLDSFLSNDKPEQASGYIDIKAGSQRIGRFQIHGFVNKTR